VSARAWFLQPGVTALAIGMAWSVALALACRSLVDSYFPLADEWWWVGMSPQWEWVTSGLAGIAPGYPGLGGAGPEYIRPLFNLGYWLLGGLFGDDYGAYLYLNYVAIGACAGAAYLAAVRPADEPRTRALKGAFVLLLPLMPFVWATRDMSETLVSAMMAYDPLIAALCLLAYCTYVREKYLVAAALLFVALFTKETALPAAVALPLTLAWTHRREWRRHLWPLLALATPVAAWLAVRLVAFGHVHDSTGSMGLGPLNIVKLPLQTTILRNIPTDPLGLDTAFLLGNLIILATLAVAIARRSLRDGPDAADVTLIFAFLFMAVLAPTSARLAALLDCFLFVAVLRTTRRDLAPPWRNSLIATLLAFTLLNGAHAAAGFDATLAQARRAYDFGHRYAAAIAQHPTETVVILSDPVSCPASPATVASTLGLSRQQLLKASDFPMPPCLKIRPAPCDVAVQVPAPGRVVLTQSCGFLLVTSAYDPGRTPFTVKLADGIRATFPEQAEASAVNGMPSLGQKLELQIERDGVRVLYFDPRDDTFRWVAMGGAHP
jgi:hypothetical protein